MALRTHQRLPSSSIRVLFFVRPCAAAKQSPLRRGMIRAKSTFAHQPSKKDFTTSSPTTPTIEFGQGEQLAAPLAALPTGSLVRSLCIHGITSKRWLLTPAIVLMARWCKSSRSRWFSLEGNRLLAWLTKVSLYKQFCAGETPAEVRATMQGMKAMGFRGTILTYAQETVFDARDGSTVAVCATQADSGEEGCPTARAWCDGTMQTVDLLAEGDQLAIKCVSSCEKLHTNVYRLTGAGPTVTEALAAGQLPPQAIVDTLEEISRKCRDKGSHVVIDAESQRYQAGITRVALRLMKEYNRDGRVVVYNSYQAYLKGLPSTLAAHLRAARDDGFTLGLKLVRGAYLASDPRHLMHDSKEDTDRAYDAIVDGVLRRDLFGFGADDFPPTHLLVASHNAASIRAAHRRHQQRTRDGRPTVPVRFAQLQGMADELSFGLLQMSGPDVYKCSTWGRLGECVGYLARRATENRDAAARTIDAYTALKREARRRLRAACTRRT